MRRKIGLIGVPLGFGAGKTGSELGVNAMRLTRFRGDTLAGHIRELGFEFTDHGDVEIVRPSDTSAEGNPKHLAEMLASSATTIAKLKDMLAADEMPIILGGDHAIAIPTFSAVSSHYRERSEEIGLIWFDAHADINTPETSPSGNIHGMPLAAIMGRGHPELVGIGGPGASVRTEDVIIIGLRSVDVEEKNLLREAGVRVYTMKDIDAYGAARVVRSAIKGLSHVDRVHLSLDLDAVDPEVAPGVGTPVRGGLTYREAHLLMELVNEAGIISSLDVVEVNPILDIKNGTATLAVELVESLMGRRIIDLPRER